MREIKGNIQLLGLFEFLQIVGFNHRDLVLMLNNDTGYGNIVISDGNVIDATLDGGRGVGALFPLLMGAYGGDFSILPPPTQMPDATVTMSLEAILMRVAMNLPQDAASECSPSALIKGDGDLLSAEELLQLFETNKRGAQLDVQTAENEEAQIFFAEGSIFGAQGFGREWADAVYPLFETTIAKLSIKPFTPPGVVERMLDIPSIVMEGLRRQDEKNLLLHELTSDENPHVQEILEGLDRGELDVSARVALAKRYLPGGEVAPAFVVARLTVDESDEVRKAAMETLLDLPEPIVEAFANDPDTPGPLLFYLACSFKQAGVITTAIGNPSIPVSAVVQVAKRGKSVHLSAIKKRIDLLSSSRELRDVLRTNSACDFPDLLDKFDAESAPKMRKRAFTAIIPKEREQVVLETPEVDPRKEKPEGGGKLSPRDIQYLAKRGTLREKMNLVCGNDDDIAHEVVSQPGLPESFILGVAEAKAANSAALRYIAGHRSFLRNMNIVQALLFNPKTPVSSATPLLSLVRPDVWGKLATSRDIPDGTKQAAKHLIDKRTKNK